MPPAVLYRNEAGTVFLLDVPASIQNGQNTSDTLRSSVALESPYPSTEPRGTKRETAMAAISLSDRLYHDSAQEHISRALAEIRDHLHASGRGSSWCHPCRALFTEAAPSLSVGGSLSAVPVILSTTELRTKFSSLCDLEGNVVCNLQSIAAIITTTNLGDFFIPARSTFVLASLENGLSAFQSGQEEFSAGSPGFDLILMDPPWSNRSVRHSGAYRTRENQFKDPFEQALSIVRRFIAPQGWVAVWTSNKSSIRAQVLESFQALGFSLQEEWVWIKITTHGAPVTRLDGIWRRPYEILLLFQKDIPLENTKRRVIAAVPDIHSRKPCLKMLLEELLPLDYRALELFARSLTAGWWSWGDEVLKFQHESYWVDGEDCRHQTQTVDEPVRT